MKKFALLSAVVAATTFFSSCGESKDGEIKKDSAPTPKTIKLEGNVNSFAMGGFPLVIAVGQYTDNFSSDKVKGSSKKGKKIIAIEVCVINNGKVEANVPPASFTLDDITTEANENIKVSNMIAMKMDSYSTYKGDVRTSSAKGLLYYEVDAKIKPENLQVNILNVMNGDKQIGTLPLKSKEGFKASAENSILEVPVNTLTIEDIVFKGKGSLTIDKVTDNYTDGKEDDMANPYKKKVKIEFTIKTESGAIYGLSLIHI